MNVLSRALAGRLAGVLTPLCAAALLAACASATSTRVATNAANDNDKDVLCEQEARTGSNLPTKRCRSALDREADRRNVDAASEASRNIRAGQTGKPGT